MGNHQTVPTGNAENQPESHHHSISKTLGRGKNFMRLGRKRLSGTWDTSSSKLSHGSDIFVENEFSNVLPSMSMERHSIASADVCRDIAGVQGEKPVYIVKM